MDASRPLRRAPWRQRLFLRLTGLYPPYLLAGIGVERVAPDLSEIAVRMRLWPWNRNAVGTHFGGSLYSMCDPFFMLVLLAQLGKDYIVWDKAATIRFRRPGRGTVRATFTIPAEEVDRIRAAADRHPKVEPTFSVEVTDAAGEVVAEVEKVLHVRRKDRAPAWG